MPVKTSKVFFLLQLFMLDFKKKEDSKKLYITAYNLVMYLEILIKNCIIFHILKKKTTIYYRIIRSYKFYSIYNKYYNNI